MAATVPLRLDRRQLAGPVGAIDIVFDWPAAPPDDRPARAAGVAIIGHPHPLFGGALENKVAATIARAFAAAGWLAVRPNFRGVGASDGTHDEGRGETDDFVFVAEKVPTLPDVVTRLDPQPRLALAGFSFGSFVAAQAAERLTTSGHGLEHLVLVGTAAGKWPMPVLPAAMQPPLLIHGELDETIALAAVLDWARPQLLDLVVLAGAGHFFHGRLTQLKRIVLRHLAASNAVASDARDTDSSDTGAS